MLYLLLTQSSIYLTIYLFIYLAIFCIEMCISTPNSSVCNGIYILLLLVYCV